MSKTPEVIELAEQAYAEAMEIIAKPPHESALDRSLKFRTLAERLRGVLDFLYGFQDELPELMTRVDRIFDTLQESAPGRWHVKRFIDDRNGMIVFQERVADLAKYLRGK